MSKNRYGDTSHHEITSAKRPLRILFFMRHIGYTRNFERCLQLLAKRGHMVHLAFDRVDDLDDPLYVERLTRKFPSISYGPSPDRYSKRWSLFARELRAILDYLRYLDPVYRDATKLRARAERRVPSVVRWLAGAPFVRSPAGIGLLTRFLRLVQEGVPTDRALSQFIAARTIDTVLITPLVEFASMQPDYVRAARHVGVRTLLCVASWDNLTNKGLIHEHPDRVAVWNEAQRCEAVEMHGVPANQVVVTGASAYDHWFDWEVSTTRAEFCRRIGLCTDRPFFLYVCSSPFIAPEEVAFVRTWIEGIRKHGNSSVQDAGILIRPHPQNGAQWQNVNITNLDNVVIWPRAGANPIDADSRADFYDSMYHCAGVVGVNTSALIESAIVDRPVYTIMAPEFQETQEGTLHFRHLLHVNGGLLNVAHTFEEHAAQLAEALRPDGQRSQRNRRFLEAFVRPCGLGEPASPLLVTAVERLSDEPTPLPVRRPARAVALSAVLLPVVYLLSLYRTHLRGRRSKGNWRKMLGRRRKRIMTWALSALRSARRLVFKMTHNVRSIPLRLRSADHGRGGGSDV